MTLHLKSRGYPFCPRLLFSSFIVVGVGFPNCVLFQERTGNFCLLRGDSRFPRERLASAEMQESLYSELILQCTRINLHTPGLSSSVASSTQGLS